MKNVFVTGATGFVGSYLLSELVNNEGLGKIYVMVRQYHSTDIENFNYLEKCNMKYGVIINHKNYMNKVNFIAGDISVDNLGLDDNWLSFLANNIDIIYHVAAEVNHIKSYEQLKKANVDSIIELIKLAGYGRTKIINFISTLGSATLKDANENFLENYPDDCMSQFNMGYLQSKYMAEKILAKAFKEEQIQSNIFRLGYISGNSKTGLSLFADNQLMLFIKSCIQLKLAPNIHRTINLTPVDQVAKIIASNYYQHSFGNVLHVFNYKEFITLSEIIKFLNLRGFPIHTTDLSTWQQSLVKLGKKAALYRMILTYRKKDADNVILRFGKNIEKYKYEKNRSFCQENSIEFPYIKYNYFNKIVEFLESVGFFTKP